MPEITLQSQVRVSEDAVFRELDGEAVILQLDGGLYFGLDAIGTRLWQLIEGHGTLSQVFEIALEEFEVAPAVLERDLLDLVRQLEEKHLIEVT